MKVFIIFAICVTSAFAATTTKDQFNKFATECLQEMGINPVILSLRDNKMKEVTKKEESCYLACLDKKQGLMKKDGTYDADVILSYVETPEMKVKVQTYIDELMKTCKLEAGNDECKLAACYHRMPKAYWGKE